MPRNALADVASMLAAPQRQEQRIAKKASRDQYGWIALDEDGNPTVLLDGGEEHAPCTAMVGVHHGDRVMCHIVNHRIVVFANVTAPTTDDATALVAIDRADTAAEAADAAGIAAASAQADATAAKADAATAKTAAQGAVSDAANAKAAATQAQADAKTAKDNAAQAVSDAATAKQAATDATTTANGAVTALATVQGVVNQLETDVDELQVHVAMMDAYSDGHGGTVPAGLHVVPTDSGYFLVIANDGTYVYDAQSVLVTKFGESIDFSSTRPQRIGNETAYIEYYDSNNDGIPDSIRISGTNLNTEIANFRQTVSETYATKGEAKQTASDSDKREIVTEDAAELPLLSLTAYGESVQDGTPTPDAPVHIQAVRSRNIADIYFQSGYIDGSTGNINAASSVRKESTSDFIPVIPGEKLVFQVWVTPTLGSDEYLWMAYTFYNSNKAYYGGGRPSQKAGANTGLPQYAVYTITVPSGVSYIRISGRMYNDGVAMLERGSVMHDYVPYGHIAAIATGKNLLDPAQVQAKRYINRTSGNIATSNGWSCTGFIPIIAGKTYTLSGVSQAWSGVAGHVFYDYEQNYLSYLEPTVTQITVPSGAAYVRLSLRDETPTEAQFELGTTATDYEPYRESVSYLNLKGEELCSLPDGTEDVLTVDASGHAVIEKLVAYTDAATTDGVSATVGTDAWSTTGDLSDGADVYYPLAEPRTIDLGYIDLPTTFPNGTVHVEAEIQPVIDGSWWTAAGYEAGLAYNEGSTGAELSALTERVSTAESTITQQAGEIALKANAADTYTKAQTDASLTLKANKATLTSEINASADTVKIDATRVNIEGAAIFTGSGRLSQDSLDNAYDASGAASGAVSALTTDLASSSGTTVIDGGHIETNSLTIGQVSNLQSTLDDAAKTATNYIEADADGIKIFDSPTSKTAGTYQHQTATSTEFFVDGESMASFGAEGYKVGDESALHQVGDGTSLSFRNGSETVAYVSTDKFYSVNSEVEDAFYIGDYSIRNASDGKLVIGLRR